MRAARLPAADGQGAGLVPDPDALGYFGFKTQRSAKQVLRELESLRNHLAHAQDIVTNDWPQIARLVRRIEELSGPEP